MNNAQIFVNSESNYISSEHMMMNKINHYEIIVTVYHDEICARLSYKEADGMCMESALYSLPEIINIVTLWQMGGLRGSFANGTTLDAAATFTIRGSDVTDSESKAL